MRMNVWEIINYDTQKAINMLGIIPELIYRADMPVVEQVNQNYAHGGGWQRFPGFKLNRADMSIKFPGDPAFLPCAKAQINEKETVYVYPYAWVLIDRGGDDWEISRMD